MIAGVTKLYDAKGFRCWRVLRKLLKKQVHTLVFQHHLTNSNVVFIPRSTVGPRKNEGNGVFHKVQYGDIDKAYVVVLFEHLKVA